MRPSPTRRTFLYIAGSSVAAGLAGCSESSADDDGAADDDAEPSTDADGSSTNGENDEPGSDDGSDETEEPATDGESEDEEPTDPEIAMITDNKGSYFDPKGLLVEPGTTVRFVNESGSHDTTAYHPDNDKARRIPEDADGWASDLYTEAGKTFEVTLETEGVYDFCCTPHESMGMVGRIVVGEATDGPATEPPDELPPGARDELPAINEIVEHERVSGP